MGVQFDCAVQKGQKRTMSKSAIALLLTLGFATGARLTERVQGGGLPQFSRFPCEADLCILVTFGDGSSDILETNQEKINGEPVSVWKGKAVSTGAKAVIIPRDDNGVNSDKLTIVFKSLDAGACTRFSVVLGSEKSGSGKAQCLDHAPKPSREELEEDEFVEDRKVYAAFLQEDRSMDRSNEEIMLAPRALDPNGYKIRVAVHYDDMFATEFKSDAVNRVTAIMAIVDEMYSEKDSLKTEIEVNTVAIEHAKGENWGLTTSWCANTICDTCTIPNLARKSKLEVDLHIFMTGSDSIQGLGLAHQGSVCDPDMGRKFAIVKYAIAGVDFAEGGKDSDAYNAETVAHEMGHSLGMHHDCINGNCRTFSSDYKGPRTINGEECYGYMDYNDDTNYWSQCSISDLTSYINRQQKFCLEPIKPQTVSGTVVCNNIRVRTNNLAAEFVWAFGSCLSKMRYERDKEYNIECCQPEGEYELRCLNTKMLRGWQGGYIQIGESDTKYCEDFDEGAVQAHPSVQHTAALNSIYVDVKLTTKAFGWDISWDLGGLACYSIPNGINGYYWNYLEYESTCFMPGGNYILSCKDKSGDGWNGAYIEIAGTKYCEDFDDGYIKTVTVTIG